MPSKTKQIKTYDHFGRVCRDRTNFVLTRYKPKPGVSGWSSTRHSWCRSEKRKILVSPSIPAGLRSERFRGRPKRCATHGQRGLGSVGKAPFFTCRLPAARNQRIPYRKIMWILDSSYPCIGEMPMCYCGASTALAEQEVERRSKATPLTFSSVTKTETHVNMANAADCRAAFVMNSESFIQR